MKSRISLEPSWGVKIKAYPDPTDKAKLRLIFTEHAHVTTLVLGLHNARDLVAAMADVGIKA